MANSRAEPTIILIKKTFCLKLFSGHSLGNSSLRLFGVFSPLASLYNHIIRPKKQITKAHISLRDCAGWSARLL